jgi:hypothetical protein
MIDVVVIEGCQAWIQENVSGCWWQWHIEGPRNRAHGECDTEEQARDIIRLLVPGVRP